MSWLMQIVLQWILGCMCLFELWFSQGICTAMCKVIVNGNLLYSTGAQLCALWWPTWVYIDGMGVSREVQEGGDICIHIWVGKIPWKRKWQPTPVSLRRESDGTEEPGRLQSLGSQRVGHDMETKQQQQANIHSKQWLCRSQELEFFLWSGK